METLTQEQMLMYGGGDDFTRCGSSTGTFVFKLTCAAGAGFIGFGLSAGNVGIGFVAAGLGFKACHALCFSGS